jgi:hypothetical protein
LKLPVKSSGGLWPFIIFAVEFLQQLVKTFGQRLVKNGVVELPQTLHPAGLLLATLICYANWAAYQGNNYLAGNYLSPLYSPLIDPSWLPFSPAFLILLPPVLFRATCYYYRKAYYRAFVWAPPACAVPDARAKYFGESRFPLVLQNIHRYFFYLSIPVLAFLWWDALLAFHFHDGFGLGVGTLVLLANASLLTLYTLSCHACRHVCGGGLDRFSKAPARYRLWKRITVLNAWHAQIAWLSLFGVALTDLYVRLVATGAIRDLRLF